ncbi:DUF805 domain-containing protein [Thioclava sp.]|uniref:DUF805 domain-containing protein n=1 Tax=Thioclava sp. TaxID=1933450 RepID=UPI003AA8AE96
MRPSQAIKICIRKSFIFSGRSSRSEFWWFFPVGIAFAITATWGLLPIIISLNWYTKYVFAFFLLIPVWAAGSRRLQDTGEDGKDIFFSAVIFFGIPMISMLGVTALSAANIFIAIIVFGFLYLPIIGITIFLAFMFLGPTIGQLLVPSERSSNKFGPNPNEGC